MNKTQSFLAQLAILALAVGIGLYVSNQLPEIVPVHWGPDNKPNGYGPKWMDVWLMPGMIAFMSLMTFALPAISPKKFEIDRFASTFGIVMFACSLLMLALHGVILEATLHAVKGGNFDIGKWMMVILFAFFAVLGNLMGRVKQNYFMGIRTPWTLSDERVWNKTHREAGQIWLIGGLVGVWLCLFGVPALATLPVFLVMALLPVVRSYIIYRQFNPNGAPPAETS